jgi:hypothetical protein
MYKSTVRKKIVRTLIFLVLAGAIAAAVVFRGEVKRFFLYIDSRISQEGAAPGQGTLFVHEPRILIRKAQRQMQFFDGDRIARTYRVGLGFSPVGDKEREGDGRTPEGFYYICAKNPESRFCLSLGLSYPNTEDAKRGLEAGLITEADYERIATAIGTRGVPPWDTALGGEIYIHGHGSKRDWTAGCIALDDAAVQELYTWAPVGTIVEIAP